jgi:glycosyltransferase involved in cell wall biosynthesis
MISFLFVDTERVWRGGQEQLFSLLRGLRQRGHEVHLICDPNSPLETRSAPIQVAVHPLSIRSEIGPISLVRLRSLVLRIRPDILAFNTPKAILIGTLASRCTSVGARIVFRRVNFPLRKSFFTRLKYTWGIDRIVSISDSIRLRLNLCGVPDSKISTIYEGIDLSNYPRTAHLRKPGEPATVGVVAHLSREKGIHYLVEAASLIPEVHRDIRFVIVGEGTCLPELKQLVQEKGLEPCFQFLGFRTDVAGLMRSFDIFALPSLSEGLSSAILEAMASSLPVVASDVGGIPELIKNGENGLLVTPADPVSLAAAIQQMAENPEKSMRMGQAGRERVEKNFTLEEKILRTEELCTSLLIGSQPSHA